ncbi:DUF7619 domain-containing protein [Caldisericum exile]|uniref:DUF11 domain-containing protein n=1 Tax=Caldisericum exile (strain DSM 21853 / NBRC 104410 / AZM16c01) TaxID=511051 RepID=A0A7U6GDL3_CALEA|nr:isopeptide-forming domain-containing fimbrial protein [Caldisericum exile]BAL80367.1 hypothetical protein CSE_02410 [Caldisericum exile AZM16c01]
MRKKLLSLYVAAIMVLNLVPWGKVIAAPSLSVLPSTSQQVEVNTDAIYKVTITNPCSENDVINITFSTPSSGWNVALYDSDNATLLSDHNGDGIPDTGSLQRDESKDIYVHVRPSSSVCNGSQLQTTITATSTNGNCGGSATVTLTTTAVNEGILVITEEVSPNEAKVGDTVTWTIHIKNVSSNPIGNVHISDTLGSGISYPTNFTFYPQPSSGTFPNWVYNEIPTNTEYTISFNTVILGCKEAQNVVDAWWGVEENSACQTQHVLSSVKIKPTVPNIQFSAPNISVPYCGSTDVTIPITNNGDGVAKNFKLKIDTIPSGYQISNFGQNWNYNSQTGEFIYLGGNPQGTINPNETVNLAFTVSMPQGACSLPSATLKFFSEYLDPCGDPYTTPSLLGSISVSGSGAYFTISKEGPDPVDIGETNKTYTIFVTYHKGNCSSDTVTVDIKDTLPNPFIPQSASDSGQINGQTVIWDNIILQDGVLKKLTITFNVSTEPCYAGQEYTNTVQITGPNGETLTDCCGCPIQNVSATWKTYVNDPSLAIVDSKKSASPSSIEIDCSTDVGPYTNPSGNADSHNDRRYTVEYDFNTGTNAPSSWNNTDGNGGHIIFRDQLNNNQFTNAQIGNVKIEVSCDGGNSWNDLSNYATVTYPANIGDPLVIDLAQLEGHACPPNSGAKLRISFTARATQTNDLNNSKVSYDYIDWSTLEIPGFPRGCFTDPKYYEGVRVTDIRANLTISANLTQTVEKCAIYNLTINFSKDNANVDHADLTLTLNGFTYISNSTTYSDGGLWCSGTKGEPSVSQDGKTLTWAYSQINEVSSNGSITIQVKKDCSNNASIVFSSNYLDNCGKSHTSSGSESSILIKSAVLYTKLTPQYNFAYAHTVDWKVYVINGGDGTAREIILTTILGNGLSFSSQDAYIKIGNTTYYYGDTNITWPSNGSTGTLTWGLNNLSIDPAQQVEVYFKTDVNTCDITNLKVEAYSNWCTCQESNHDEGQVELPTSYALVIVNSANFTMCSGGSVEVQISNPGITNIYNASLTVLIPKYISYSANSTTYSYNGGPPQSAGDPMISPISGGDYDGGYELVWDKTKISQLQDLAPNDNIVLKFNIAPDNSQQYSSCAFLKSGFKKVKAYANFAKPCDVNNPSLSSNIFEKDFETSAPDLLMTKKVVQIDNHDILQPVEYFPQELGKEIIFEIKITNNGKASTIKTNFADVLKAPNRHPLILQSAEYSYDGGTYNSIPWSASTDDSNNTIYIWNNIEGTLGHGIEPNKTLTIRVKTKISETCTQYVAHEISELWTGCSDLPDMGFYGNGKDLLLWSDPSVWSGFDGTLSSADCPIYQGKFARTYGHKDSWAVVYSNDIPSNINVCDQNVQFEVGFKNGEVYQGATTIYGPLTIFDVLPRGFEYVSGSTEFLLPGQNIWIPGLDPTISTQNWITSTNIDWNGTFTVLEWNKDNNLILQSINISPGQEIHVRFKVNLNSCVNVKDVDINRQRLEGNDCSGTFKYYFPAGNEQNFDWWEKDYWPYIPDYPWIKQVDILKPKITIEKTVDKSFASPSDSLLFMIHIKNTGDGDSRHFKIIDKIPNGFILDSSSITDGPPPGYGTTYTWMTHTYDSNTNTITWQSNQSPNYEFPHGAETTVSFRVLVSGSASGEITNEAKFEDNCCYSGSNILTSTKTVKITSTPIRVIKEIVDVNGIPVTSRPVRTQPGDLVRFRIKVENRGSLPIYNVDVYDTLPNGIQYQVGSSRYALTNGSLPTTWTNTTDPHGAPYDTPPSPPQGFSGLQWHIQQTLLATDDNGGTTGGNLDTLYLEFVAKVTSDAQGSPSGEYNVNTSNMSGTTDQLGNTPIERSIIETSNASDWFLVYKPSLLITKTVTKINSNASNTTRVAPNDTVTYQITITNTSSFAKAKNITINDTLPYGFSYIDNSSSISWSEGGSSNANPTISGQNLTWNLINAVINSGESLILTFNAKVTSNANIGQNENIASALGYDLDTGSYSANSLDGTGVAKTYVVVTKPEIRVSKFASISNVPVQTPVTFTIKIESLDSYAKPTIVAIVDNLPVGWEYVQGSSYLVKNNGATPINWGSAIVDPSSIAQTLTWNVNQILDATDDQGGSSGSASDTLWLKFQATPTNSSLGCSNTNTVSVSWEDGYGTTMADVSSSTNVCVCYPKLDIEKSANKTEARINEDVEFTIKVSNKNPVDAFNVDVYDYLWGGSQFVLNSAQYALTNGSTPSSWNNAPNPSIDGTTLHFYLNITIEGTDDNGGATGSKNDTLFLRFKAHPTSASSYGINTNMAVAEGKDSGGNLIGSPVASVSINVRKPDITITKSSNPTSQNVNGTITYTITATNNGNENLINGTIIDTLPNGVTYVSSGGGGVYNAGPPATVTWNGVSIPANGGTWSATVSVKITKNVTDGEILTNSVSGSGTDTQGNNYSFGPATAQTTVNAPKLTISKVDSPDPVKAGGNITYTITVSNNGSAPASNVVITDTIPTNTTFVSASFIAGSGTITDPGVGNTGTVTWALAGTLDAGNSVIVQLVVKVNSPINDNTIIHNTATVDSEEQGPLLDTEQTIVSSLPNLVITKSASENPVRQDRDLTYTIRCENSGTMNLTNVVVTDTLPNGITFVSATPNPTNINGQTLTWNIGSLPSGSSFNIIVTVHVNQNVPSGTVLTNSVNATSDQVSASATCDTTIGAPANLTISKSDNIDPVPAGQNIIYTIKYQNTGGQTATGVMITDILPSNVIYVSSNPSGTYNSGPPATLTWNIGSLPAGSSGTITVTVQVPVNTTNGTVFTNNATISSDNTNPVSDSEDTTVLSAPVLTINKTSTMPHNPAQPGDTVTYTITYGNNGNLTAANTFIVDKIPANTKFIVGSVTGEQGVSIEYSNDNGTTWTYTPVDSGDGTDLNVTDIRWTIGSLAPNITNQTASFKVKINSPLPNGTIITNTATIDCDQTNPVNAQNDFMVGSTPNLHITKTGPSNVNAGDTITYTVEYWNDGNMTATGVVITETYDANVEFISATPSPDTGTNNRWTIGNVFVDNTHHTITITVKVKSPLPNGTVIHNTVTIDSDQTDPKDATFDTTVGSAPILTITKVDTQDPVQAGDNIIYTITVGNTGNAPATNVVVIDTIPANTTFVSARFISKAGTIDAPTVGGTGTVKWTLTGSLNPNEEFVVELIVKVNKPLDNGTIIHNTAHVSCAEDTSGKDSSTDTKVESAPILLIDKVDLHDPVNAGDNITYRITISNTGNMNAHNVIITDTVPNNTTFVSASFITGSGTITAPNPGSTGTVTYTLSNTLDIGTSVVVELVVKTNTPLPNGTQIQNTASVKSSEIQTPITDSEITTIGSSPVLQIAKVGSPNPVSAGQNITYTITVKNVGNMDATQFIITDSVPPNTTFVSARFVSGATGAINAPQVGGSGTVEWIPNPNTLPVGATVVVELVVKTYNSLPSGTVITNTAYADSAQTQQIASSTTTTVGGEPILKIFKSAYPTEQAPKGVIIYSIRYVNEGNAPATNVVIQESYPPEVEFFYANPMPTYNTNTWVIPKLDASSEGYITVAVKVKENIPLTIPPVKVTNTVSIRSTEVQNPVSASASFEVKAPNFWDPANVTQRKEVDPKGNVAPGMWLTYTNYFGNSGNAPATNVYIIDTLDTNLDETTLQISDGTIPGTTHTYNAIRREIIWHIPVIQPGENGSVSFKVMVRSTINGYTLISNTTTIKSDQNPEGVQTNTVYNTVIAPCPVTPIPPTPPTPSYSINLSINVPETICASAIQKYVFTFTNGTPPYVYEIDFGDNSMIIKGEESGNFITLEHIYQKSGNYEINLKVKDKSGKEATLSYPIQVKDCIEEISIYHHNFIIGYPDNTVRPERNVSRVEVAAMILRALGISVNNIRDDIIPFKDIPITHWGYNFTRQIYLEGLMQGDEKGNFNADRFATRAEIAAVLVRLKGISIDTGDPLFKDTEPKKWYTPYITAAVKAGLITGYPDKTFKPNNNVTRAEFVAMLERVLYRTDVPQVKNLISTENIINWKDITKAHWAYYIMLEAWQPHIVKNVVLIDTVIKVKSKIIPVYLPKPNTVIEFPKIGTTISSVIVPVVGIVNDKLPQPRNVFVKIINTESP